MLSEELKTHLCECLIPFWKNLQDVEYGGYYGWMDSDLKADRYAVKGCILNSRILWFFSNARICLQEILSRVGSGEGRPDAAQSEKLKDLSESLREYADCAYRFLRDNCIDHEKGGVYWSVDYRGRGEDTTKHTYNQAFAVYALSSCFRAYHDREALKLADELVGLIETRCFDSDGYKEALDREFRPIANDKLSENGVMADRTMNTLLHVMEAYTEYLLACREAGRGGGHKPESAGEQGGSGSREDYGTEGFGQTAEKKLRWMLDLVEKRIYNPERHRQEVFFNLKMESLIDLHSYGHDIEAAWLIDRCLETLGDRELTERMSPILRSLENEIYEKAYSAHSLANECERGVVDEKRVWWVQAEGVVGFYNAWQKTGERRYLEAAEDIWGFIRKYLVDKRPGGEWFWYTDASGSPALDKPIVEPWKCPYHNGRMCMEIIKRDR